MTKREAAIVTAFTGKMLGDFSIFHGYVEEILERPVFTHEMGDKKVAAEIRDKAREDFVNIEVQ
jgi:hypothetical protein